MSRGSSIFTSQLVEIENHRLDLIFEHFKIEIPTLDTLKGSDIISIIKQKQIQNFIICRNSTKNNNFYDVLYSEPADPEITQRIDNNFKDFTNLPLTLIFQANKFVVTRYQRSALFIFSISDFKEQLAIYEFSNNKQTNLLRYSPLFKRPEKQKFQIKLPTGIVIPVKISMLEPISNLLVKAHSKMTKLYPDSLIRPPQFYRFFTKFGVPNPKNPLKDEKMIIHCLNQQKKNPSTVYFFLAALKASAFDKPVADYTRELELATIPPTEEANIFNSEMSILRQDIEKTKQQLKQTNPLWSKIVLSTTDPSLPEKKIEDRYVIMKASINMDSQKLSDSVSTSSAAIAVRVNYDTTANEAICMFIDKLNTMQKTQETKRLPFGMEEQNSNEQRNSFNSKTKSNEQTTNNNIELPSNNQNTFAKPGVPLQPVNNNTNCNSTQQPQSTSAINEPNSLGKPGVNLRPVNSSSIPNSNSNEQPASTSAINEQNPFAKFGVKLRPVNSSSTPNTNSSEPPSSTSSISEQSPFTKFGVQLRPVNTTQNTNSTELPSYKPKDNNQNELLNPNNPNEIVKHRSNSTKGSNELPLRPNEHFIGHEHDGLVQKLRSTPNIKSRKMSDPEKPNPETRNPITRRQTLLTKPVRVQSQMFSENKISLEQITQLQPENFVLIISGTDEVLTGDTPISHFVAVRHFILSDQPILSVSLHNKNDIISLIETNEDSLFQAEVNPNISPKPLTVTKYPSNFKLNSFGYIPQSEVKSNIKINIQTIYNIKGTKDEYYFIRVCLMYGMKLLCKSTLSELHQGRDSLLINEKLEISLPLCNIPREARISITLYKYDSNQTYKKNNFLTEEQISQQGIQAAATINRSLYNFSGWLDSDHQTRRMWRNKDIDYFLTTCESNDEDPILINYSLSSFKLPICYIPYPSPTEIESPPSIPVNDLSTIEKLRRNDPLTPLTDDDRQILWKYRKHCSSTPELLPLLMESIDYNNPQQVREIPLLLKIWNKPPPMLALSLLDAKYANKLVRDYAVSCIEPFTDNEVFLFLLQLVQALKYELYEDSSLARFLLRRALIETRLIGHQLFWQLMSEAHLSHIRNRFSLMIVNFMYGVGSARTELIKGYRFTQDLVKLNKELSNLSYQAVQEPFREALKRIEIPKQFHLPVDSRLTVENFEIDKCKVMNSKKKPFFLVFKNAAPFATEPVMTMFKVGDDLRQDQLILQIMKVMDHLWKNNDLDFRMRLYGVLPTGLNQGFIEVVQNAVTESDLQVDKGTFNKQIFIQFLQQNNPTDNSFEAARRNFLMSSCGYAVSTCVLGVADRHPGNIMIQRDGHFFHIDYGHFLGNFKTKYGIQCEDAPFHFINAHVALLDGLNSIYFKTFLDESGKALNVLRKNARLLITILMLMLGTGIPELTKAEDINYFKKMLFLNLNDKEASEKFKELTMQSLSSWKTLLKAKVHNVKVG